MAEITVGSGDAPACVLYSGPASVYALAGAPSRAVEELLTAGAVTTSPAVLLADASVLAQIGDAHSIPDYIVIVALDRAAESALGARADLSVAPVSDVAGQQAIVHAACLVATARFATMRAEEEFLELSRIGMGLVCERDRKALLRQIVAQSKELTRSDAGGLLLLRTDEDGRQWLQPVLYAFDSLDGEVVPPTTLIPVDERSIIGHVALSNQPVVVADAYAVPNEATFELGVDFDERNGYRRRSLLAVPMTDQLDRVLGVLLLINRKTDPTARITSEEAADRHVIEYSAHEVRVARLLASQAAVAIENTRLYAQVEEAFESFVAASVSAIDLRDPATAGHSLRVAALSTILAERIDRADTGTYRDVHFTEKEMRELRFAALLHDFGKVAVREDVLLKARKLPPVLRARVDARFDLIRSSIELAWCSARASAGATTEAAEHLAALEELEHCRQVVRDADEPSVLAAPRAAELLAIAERTFEPPDGTVANYLTADELHFLELPKGTLDERERAEAESHVTKTYQFLSQIPWTDDLKNMVTYAYGHHEALDGSGYPRGLVGENIPLQTRLITVADMFDALTAADRPYKPAIPVEQALAILRREAEAGHVDGEVVRLLEESESERSLKTPPA